jgi:hypothetical protein
MVSGEPKRRGYPLEFFFLLIAKTGLTALRFSRGPDVFRFQNLSGKPSLKKTYPNKKPGQFCLPRQVKQVSFEPSLLLK